MTDMIVKSETAAPVPMRPGIYFGLSDVAYHADPSLGSGSIRALAKCPIYYWLDSWMNPLRTATSETPALIFGRALHTLVLEGVEAFQATYVREIGPADHPEALVTMDDLKSVLRAVGGKVSGVKDELKQRVRELDPNAVIWDDLFEDFNRRTIETGKTKLHADVYDRVVQGALMITGDERIRAAFQGGRPEISLFWDADGVPMKERLDYVRLGKGQDGAPIGLITDLKSYANTLDKPPEVAVVQAIANTRLDIQAAAYLDGVARIPQFFANGQVYGADGINPDWLEQISKLTIDRWLWTWCFYEKDTPISLLRSTRPGSAMMEAATMDVRRAQQAYRDNMAAFGTAWRFVDPMPDNEVQQSDLPKWLYLTA